MNRRRVLAATVGLLATPGCLRRVGLGEEDAHEHLDASGEMEVVVDGEPVDLSQPTFQAENAEEDVRAFHLHEGHDEWFMEGHERVTIAAALDLLPAVSFENEGEHHRLVVDGEPYDEAEGAEIAVTANAEPVDPTTYQLHDGDEFRVEVTTGA